MIEAENKVVPSTQGTDRGGGRFMDNRNALSDHLPLSLSLHAFPRGFSVLFTSCTAFAIRQL